MKRDLYEEITNRVIAELESGTVPWVKPWQGGGGATGVMPYNAVSKKEYNGINIMLLWMSGYASTAWLTYKQATNLGGNVKKGEKGTHICYFSPFKKDTINAAGESETKSFLILRDYVVFNIEQCEGITLEPHKPLEVPYTGALAFAEGRGATVKHGGSKAFYTPQFDLIQMPEHKQFKTAANYEGTLLHELTHWTGHTSRCARDFSNRFGNDAYAFEELVAELGSAFLCAQLGIEGTLQHSNYIASWLRILKGDKKAVMKAASLATKACNFLFEHDINEEEESVAA